MHGQTPDLRLSSQPQGITAPWPVPNYTASWLRHVCVNNLPKVVTWKWNGRESNPRPFVSRANTLTIIPPGHTRKTALNQGPKTDRPSYNPCLTLAKPLSYNLSQASCGHSWPIHMQKISHKSVASKDEVVTNGQMTDFIIFLTNVVGIKCPK